MVKTTRPIDGPAPEFWISGTYAAAIIFDPDADTNPDAEISLSALPDMIVHTLKRGMRILLMIQLRNPVNGIPGDFRIELQES